MYNGHYCYTFFTEYGKMQISFVHWKWANYVIISFQYLFYSNMNIHKRKS